MKKNLLENLLTNLLSTNVISIPFDGNLENLVNNINSNNELLKEFSNINFIELKKEYKPNIYYEIVGISKLRLFSFVVNKKIIIIGPYLKKQPSEDDLIEILRLKNSNVNELIETRSFYYSLPILDSYHIENICNACLKTLFNFPAYKYLKINTLIDKKNLSEVYHSTDSYETILKKYEIENDFLYNIEHGLTNKIDTSYLLFSNRNQNSALSIQISNDNPQILLASLRTLSRKAAERSGLPIIIIDDIVSKYTSLMKSTDNIHKLTSFANDYIDELTQAVNNYLTNKKNYSHMIQSVIDYIYINYNLNISILDISKKFNISSDYLEHAFIKEVGKGIHLYIEDLKLSKAQELLLNTDKSISQISSYVGYYDNNYFTKVFKKRYKQTPSVYRKTILSSKR